jgi:hypothetical protein
LNSPGGDTLRRYPVEIRDGVIWLDVADPPAEQRVAQALDNLKDSFEDHEYGRMGREIARLVKAGGDPLDAVRNAIRWTHQRFEFGTTHAIAGAPDWLALRDRLAGDDPTLGLVPLLEVTGHLCWDSLRWREFPFPEGTRAFDPDALVRAIEAEDEAGAMALVRGAFAQGDGADGGGAAALEGPITRAAAAHYQDFGHSMIYADKTRQLAVALGEDMAETLYLTLARSLVYASREDLIPEFRAYAGSRAAWDGAGAAAVTGEDFHALTFANAGRVQAERHPEIWLDVLLQLACFTGRNAKYTDGDQDISEWEVDDPLAFLQTACRQVMDHGQFEYIVSVHLVKLVVAAREELLTRPDAPWARVMAAAVNRFLNSPLKRKHTTRTARQALSFVAAEG